jgi:hypothetical protein
MVVLVFLIGYLDDVTGPQTHHYNGEIVVVDKKYQCPTYCDVHHNHSVYYEPESRGMTIDKNQLGKKYKEPKKRRK